MKFPSILLIIATLFAVSGGTLAVPGPLRARALGDQPDGGEKTGIYSAAKNAMRAATDNAKKTAARIDKPRAARPRDNSSFYGPTPPAPPPPPPPPSPPTPPKWIHPGLSSGK